MAIGRRKFISALGSVAAWPFAAVIGASATGQTRTFFVPSSTIKTANWAASVGSLMFRL